MTINRIEMEMLGMTVGFTKVINGHVVTRWSKGTWEVGTWGRKSQNINEAVKEIIE